VFEKQANEKEWKKKLRSSRDSDYFRNDRSGGRRIRESLARGNSNKLVAL
jgi:hypothetical protein